MPMPWIEALKYGLTALAALFGFWAAVKVKAQGQAPTEKGTRLIERFMLFCLGLLLASALLAALVVVETFGHGRSLVVDARLAGVAFAAFALWRRAPMTIVVVGAAVVTALVRLL